MKLIIDGYNLLHKLKLKNKTTLQQKRDELIVLLQEFIKINDVDIILVFDGKNQESEHRGYENKNGIRIIYSAAGETADDVIMDLIKKRKEKAKNYAVVSSDRKILQFAFENSIRVIASDEFIEYLI